MGHPTIAFDVTRLFLGPGRDGPRGIDRVDIGYIDHLFATWPGDCFGTLPPPWGTRLFDRRKVVDGLALLRSIWLEATDPRGDATYAWVKRRLAGDVEARPPLRRRMTNPMAARRMVDFVRRVGFEFGRSATGVLPRGSLYINTGQLLLGAPFLLRWLDRRRDIAPIFMLHDVIPNTHPELVDPTTVTYHSRVVETTMHHAAGLILTTRAAASAVETEMRRRGFARRVPTFEAPLPVDPAFLQAAPPATDLPDEPYFVACGAVELRKNHLVLLQAWQRLAEIHGPRCPRLVIVGARGWRHEVVSRMIDASPALGALVIEANGLSTPALRELMSRAKGILSASLAEGFGLPIVEGLALGVPVVASDIPAHREVSEGRARLLDPVDSLAWQREVERLTFGPALAEGTEDILKFQPVTWQEYFTRMETFLIGMADGNSQLPKPVARGVKAEDGCLSPGGRIDETA